MILNDTDTGICALDAESSDVDVLDIGDMQGVGLATGLAIIAVFGFIIRGLFIYYLTYEAPKERPINSLMFEEQVSIFNKIKVHRHMHFNFPSTSR